MLTDRDEMNNPYRGPPINASYQGSVDLAEWFRERFKKIGQSEARIACVWPCLLIDRDKMSNI